MVAEVSAQTSSDLVPTPAWLNAGCQSETKRQRDPVSHTPAGSQLTDDLHNNHVYIYRPTYLHLTVNLV